MKLNIDSLKAVGAFTGRPVEKEIKWKQKDIETQKDVEYEATVFVRPAGYHSATGGALASSKKQDYTAAYIAALICDEDGKPVFTPEDITGEADPERGALNSGLSIALMVAIQEVNDLGKKKN
ncbi:phage tail assembly chaperone family protein, TAC [Serratia fonticola]|uniref:phage tail assembly chaperone family protein, TAC n=1 Tax=Serratia fonticola TaxID=47917 RepID=UPI0034C605A1